MFFIKDHVFCYAPDLYEVCHPSRVKFPNRSWHKIMDASKASTKNTKVDHSALKCVPFPLFQPSSSHLLNQHYEIRLLPRNEYSNFVLLKNFTSASVALLMFAMYSLCVTAARPVLFTFFCGFSSGA